MDDSKNWGARAPGSVHYVTGLFSKRLYQITNQYFFCETTSNGFLLCSPIKASFHFMAFFLGDIYLSS